MARNFITLPKIRRKNLRSLVSNLILNGTLTVTLTKAKIIRHDILKLSTLYTKGHVAYVSSQLFGKAKASIDKLSGAKILLQKTGKRLGDNSLCARLTLVTE